jgi:hypothetical protein
LKWYNIVLVVIILLGIIFVQREFFPNKVLVTKTTTSIIKEDSIVYKPKLAPYAVEVPVIDSVPIPIDSAALVAKYLEIHKEYFTVRYYKDSTTIDSMGYVITKFKVTQNQASEYSLHYNLEKKKIINTTTIANVKNNLYIGGVIGKENVSPMIIFNNKDRCNYIVSYNLVRSEINFGVAVNINKLKFR